MELSIDDWRECARMFYEVFPHDPSSTKPVSVDATPFGRLLLTAVTMPGQVLVHDPVIQKAANHEYLLFEQFFEGGGLAGVDGISFGSSPRRLHIIDMSRRYVSDKASSRSRGILIPHAAVNYCPGVDLPYASICIRSPMGRLLVAAHDLMTSAASTASSEEIAALGDAFTELVGRFMLGRNTQAPDDASHRIDGGDIRDFILSNLHRPDLDATLLMREFAMSRAALYRRFSSVGGVDRFIRNRRLDRCFLELVGKRYQRGKVSEVSRRMNFHDAKSFNRAFRRRFELSPSECASACSTQAKAAPLPFQEFELAHNWLRQLS